MAHKQITLIASSPNGNKSKSNAALSYAYERLSTMNVETHFTKIDIIDTHSLILEDPELASKKAKSSIKKIRASDALIIASPIYNWNVSDQLMSLMNKAISSKESNEYQLCMFLGGAESKLSLFAFEGLARALATEVNAIIIGRPVLALEEDVHYNSKGLVDNISNSLKQRIDSHLQVIHRLLYSNASIN